MAPQTVIDLTDDNDPNGPVIDLTRDSSVTPAPSRLQSPGLANGHQSKDAVPRRQKGKGRKRRQKSKQSEAPETIPETKELTTTKSLIERLQTGESDSKRTSSQVSKSTSKRKRRESIDSTATAHATLEESRPRPPKRQKSDNNKQKVINRAKSSTNLLKPDGKADQTAVDAGEIIQAPLPPSEKEQEQSVPVEKGDKKASKPKKPKSRRSSQSPMPPSKETKRKTTPRARSASLPLSTSGSNLFFVDVQPNMENKHIEEPVKSVYRVESGNLLLPEHVLLETVEEALMTPGNEVFPPPTPGSSHSDEDEIAIIDDRGTRRYWEAQIEAAELEECRTCGQFHTSKLCIGTSVCFTCGSTLHTARQCPFKTVCFRCGRTGHIRADCPVPTSELQRNWDCDLCGSQQHGTQTCSRNWRMYKYRDNEARDKDIATRLALKDLVMAGDESVDEEKFVGLEPWCYSCGTKGHLGDDCDKVHVDGRPADPSAFGQWNVLFGPFAPRYRRVAEEIRGSKGSLKPVVFGDQILDELTLSFDPSRQRFEAKVLGHLPLRPGESGRQRERERMARSRVDDRDEEQDWFSNRVERPSGSRPHDRERDSRRERDRDRDRRRRDDRNRDRERNEDRYRDRYPPRREDDNSCRGSNDRRGGHSNQRPRSPPIPPPPLPTPVQQSGRAYPTSYDMAAGYQTQPTSEFSIRGAAGRHRASSQSQTNGQRRQDDHRERKDYGRERDRRRRDDSRGNSRR